MEYTAGSSDIPDKFGEQVMAEENKNLDNMNGGLNLLENVEDTTVTGEAPQLFESMSGTSQAGEKLSTRAVKAEVQDFFRNVFRRAKYVIVWAIIAVLIGLSVGLAGAAFAFTLTVVTKYRMGHSWLLFGLPFAGVIIVFFYRWWLQKKPDGGTNNVLESITAGKDIPIAMAPLIFIATTITHLVGGSAGREGAALQLGGSIGDFIGRLFKLNRQNNTTLIMCGMSAAFSALFGTPMAAAVFPIEVAAVGIMHYDALFPCVISAVVARYVASLFGLSAEHFDLGIFPDLALVPALKVAGIAVVVGAISIFFCFFLHLTKHQYKKLIKNEYLRVMVGGTIVLILSLIVGNQTYNGTGMSFVEEAFENPVGIWVFLLKIIFTGLTLGCGYRGGEIVPTLFVGATLGSALSVIFGLPVGLCAAVGMVGMFCSVTNCPIASLLISFELFGYEAMPYYLLAVAITYIVSGYHGLYEAQKIVYSKYKSNFVNLRVGGKK